MSGDKTREKELALYNEKIWLKHPDESEESYYFFYKFFLQMPKGNRTVLGAYKKFCIVDKGYTDEETKSLSTPKNYHEWSNGKKTDGTLIEGLFDYKTRADAFDSWVIKNDIDGVLTKRAGIINRELEDANTMLDLWNMMLGDLSTAYNSERRKAKKDQKDVNISDFVNKHAKLMESRNDIAVFMRRAVGMMDKVTQDVIEQAEKSNAGVLIEWVKPPKEKRQQKEEDKVYDDMSEEEFDAMMRDSGINDRLEKEDEE